MRRIGVGSIYAYFGAKPMPESAVLAATKAPLPPGRKRGQNPRDVLICKTRVCGYLSRSRFPVRRSDT